MSPFHPTHSAGAPGRSSFPRPRRLGWRRGVWTLLLVGVGTVPGGCLTSERWGEETEFIIGRQGIVNAYREPGPSPVRLSGVRTDVPKLDESNVVEVERVTGPLRVRLAGERGARTLEYYRPRIQTSPYGTILGGVNTVARLAFADDATAVVHHTCLLTIGNAAAGEPRLWCDRLSILEYTQSAEPKLGPIELPGGARIDAPPLGRYKIALERDRYYRLSNDGKVPIELTIAGKSTWIRPSETIDLPALRNPESAGEAGATPASATVVGGEGAPARIGEADFGSARVEFDPLQPKIGRRGPRSDSSAAPSQAPKTPGDK
ncbi:MAG: hypothetical protein JNJ88_10935 [Planctomycetes bacterium]|nr:hypothetical protein [Planctomycetota bacterium]